ncbi:MAG: hypothetical protein ACFE8P_06775, partial [Promethearchaeota archaeon]
PIINTFHLFLITFSLKVLRILKMKMYSGTTAINIITKKNKRKVRSIIGAQFESLFAVTSPGLNVIIRNSTA